MVLAVLTSFDGGRLFGEVYGAGPPRVLALHGWRRDHRDFDRVLKGQPAGSPPSTAERRSPMDAPLPEGPLDALALDLPGFGSAPAPSQPWGSDEYAKAVAGVLPEMAERVVLVAHSFGGRVAVHLAASQRDRVAGLLLSGAPLFRSVGPSRSRAGSSFRFRLMKGLAGRGLVSEARLEAARRRHGSEDYNAASGVMRGVLVRALAEERAEAYTTSLAAITCPVELIWGELDTAAPPSVAARIEDCITAPKSLRVLSAVGHLTPIEIPGVLRARVDHLLEGVGP
jgi:pimeloyl-ACP methyl ester carboxylesterase